MRHITCSKHSWPSVKLNLLSIERRFFWSVSVFSCLCLYLALSFSLTLSIYLSLGTHNIIDSLICGLFIWAERFIQIRMSFGLKGRSDEAHQNQILSHAKCKQIRIWWQMKWCPCVWVWYIQCIWFFSPESGKCWCAHADFCFIRIYFINHCHLIRDSYFWISLFLSLSLLLKQQSFIVIIFATGVKEKWIKNIKKPIVRNCEWNLCVNIMLNTEGEKERKTIWLWQKMKRKSLASICHEFNTINYNNKNGLNLTNWAISLRWPNWKIIWIVLHFRFLVHASNPF